MSQPEAHESSSRPAAGPASRTCAFARREGHVDGVAARRLGRLVLDAATHGDRRRVQRLRRRPSARRGEHDLAPDRAASCVCRGGAHRRPVRSARWRSSARCSTATSRPGPRSASSKPTAAVTTVYYPRTQPGPTCCCRAPARRSAASAARTLFEKLDFLSLMLALFCGTASLPHILIRYYTVKDEAAVRKSTVVGIGAIGFFYVLTLYLGLGAMTSGALDVTNNNMAAPLLAQELQRAAVRADLGDRLHDGARHGQRPDHGRERRRRARPADERVASSRLTDAGEGPRRQDRGGRRGHHRDGARHRSSRS